MQRREQQSPKASWRKSTRKAATGVAATPEFGVQGRSRRNLIFQVSGLTALALLLGLLLIVVLMRRPDRDVPLIVAAVTRSSDDCYVPISPFAYEDVQLWEQWFQQSKQGKRDNPHVAFEGTVGKSTGEMAKAASEETSARGLIDQLTVQGIDRATPGGPNGDMLALFVIAQGMVDGDDAYLFVGDSRPEQKDTWISVDMLFQEVASALEAKDSRAVMFLDANRAGMVWDWGKLDQTFASKCKALAGKYQERLAVIVSCQDGQRSWWDLNQGHSLFARAILQAFAGHQEVDRDGNGITVGEIESFLQAEVSADANRIWGAAQLPTLISEFCDQWEFIATPSWPEKISQFYEDSFVATKEMRLKEMKDRFAKIDDLWKRHNQVRDKTHSPLVTDPLRWSILEKRLARLDQLAIAGSGPALDFANTLDECNKLLKAFSYGPDAVRAESFPELRLGDYFHSLPVLNDKDFQAVFDEWSKKADINDNPFGLATSEDREVKLTSSLWKWLLDGQRGSNASVGIANALLSENNVGLSDSPEINYLETHLIRLLAADDLGHVGSGYIDRILSLHDQSRAAIFPDDVRAAFWIRPDTMEFDDARMKLVDRMLGLGNAGKFEADLQSINGRFRDLVASGQTMSEAYLVRDQMLHEMPRIAETLMADEGAPVRDKEEVARLLKSATEATRILKESLRLIDVFDDEEKLTARRQAIKQAAMNASEIRHGLDTKLVDRANEALQSSGAGRGFRQAVALLTGSGLSDAELRSEIHTRVENVSAAQDPGGIESSGNPSSDMLSKPDEDEPMQALIDGWHPWTYWLERIHLSGRDGTVNELGKSGKGLIAQGNVIRSTITSLQDQTYDDIGKYPEKSSSEGKPLAEVRHQVEDLDLRLRSELFVLDQVDQAINEATSDRFNLDVQLFLMDHARRTMNEFWCDSRFDAKPYFAKAAANLIDIDAFPKMKSRVLDGIILSDQLEERKSIALDGNVLRAISDRKEKDLESIQEAKQIDFALEVPEFLPGGLASVYAPPKTRRLISTAAGQGSASSSHVEIPVPGSLSADNSRIAVKTFFRGLRRDGGLVAIPLGDPDTIVFQLPDYGPPKAVVRAEKQHMNAVLVFDCSDSMTVQRMNEAKGAVTKLIDKLPNESMVGLVMFGHRYMWRTELNKAGQPIPMRDRNKSGPRQYKTENGKSMIREDDSIPDNPNFDVEEIAPMQRLDANSPDGQARDHRTYLRNQINSAVATGMTPTYQAIDMAYKSLRRSRVTGRIIVVTDGDPNLSPPDFEPYRAKAIAQFKRADPEILSIIFYADRLKDQGFADAFPGRISKAAVGKLTEVLEGMIPDEEVTWNLASSNSRESAKGKFGEPVVIDNWPPGNGVVKGRRLAEPVKYDVAAILGKGERKTAPVRVDGGEAVQLEWTNDRLGHVPYIDQYKQELFDPLNVPADSLYNVYVGRARPDGSGTLNVQVAIEKKVQHEFTPRPSDIWIDIVAQDPDGDHRYSITIPEFAANEPIPILQCQIRNWPDVKAASIDVWFRMDGGRAEPKEISISDDEPASFGNAKIRVKRETKQHADGIYHVTVTESYRDPGDMNSLRVLPEPLPEKAVFEFFRAKPTGESSASENRVRRTFRYREKPKDETLWFTEKHQIEDKAIHARGELRIHTD